MTSFWWEEVILDGPSHFVYKGFLSVCLSISLSLYLSIYLSICILISVL